MIKLEKICSSKVLLAYISEFCMVQEIRNFKDHQNPLGPHWDRTGTARAARAWPVFTSTYLLNFNSNRQHGKR